MAYDLTLERVVRFQSEGIMQGVSVRLGLCVGIGLLLLGDVTFAQKSASKPQDDDFAPMKPAMPKKGKLKTTMVEVELLQADDGSGLFSQHWLKILGPMDVALRIHRPTSEEKPEVKEREVGGVRYVTAIGVLERSGKIAFPQREFAVGDTAKLKEWIEELRTYGALGTPTGKPLWGLTKEQFTLVYDGMINPVQFETFEMPLAKMLPKLPLPNESPLHWSAEANELIARRGERTKLKVELKGFSAATALAVALNENGLGFRPNRTPRGDLELLIEPRTTKNEQWPIGWPLQVPRFKSAPKFFAVVPIELTDVELSDVINAASKLTETPILVDYAELEAKQIDLDKIQVSYPRKKTTWDVALKAMTASQRLTEELWQDEAGLTFVWITTLKVGRANDREKTKP